MLKTIELLHMGNLSEKRLPRAATLPNHAQSRWIFLGNGRSKVPNFKIEVRISQSNAPFVIFRDRTSELITTVEKLQNNNRRLSEQHNAMQSQVQLGHEIGTTFYSHRPSWDYVLVKSSCNFASAREAWVARLQCWAWLAQTNQWTKN